MSLHPGVRLGPYEILSPLGAGGMGEVYRATDTNLKRSVAIKVLSESVAGDADRLARFQREAEVLAALNHPNIAQIHGLEKSVPMAPSTQSAHSAGSTHSARSDGSGQAGSGQAAITALVMELVEGDDLSVLIARGPIPLADALPIAKQIVDALEAAHERGIIHRDLKPANVKVRPDGTVKVLDFGLAKALDASAGSNVEAMNSPTMTRLRRGYGEAGREAGTEMGIILGTAAYMAPEQAKGRAVDKRADIWAFGAVLYEMLTGRRLFDAEDVSETLAAVLTRDVSMTSLPLELPTRLRALVRDCLIRDPKQRLRDIGDARLVLDRIIAGAPDDVVAPSTITAAIAPAWRRALPWVLAGVAAAATMVALAVSVVHFREVPPPVAERMRFEFPFPEDMRPAQRSVPSLSPDGRHLAFIATAADGKTRLWIRTIDGEAKPREGTEDAWGSPFWSPDNRMVVYLDGRLASARKLRKIDAFDGPSQVICDFPGRQLWGGFWTADEQIIFGTCCRFETGGPDSSAWQRLAVACPLR